MALAPLNIASAAAGAVSPVPVNMERQQALKLHLPKAVAVVGCGGVGAWLAMLLAFAGVPKLFLFDPDNVSDHNLNRLPLNHADIGKLKSEAIAEAIHVFRPQCDIMALRTFTENSAKALDLGRACEYLAATTDTLASRQLVKAYAEVHFLPYVEVAAEGDMGTVAGSPADFATADESNPGYASVPVWIGPCVMASAVAASYIVHGNTLHTDHTIRLGYEMNAETEEEGFSVLNTRPLNALKAKKKVASKPRSR